MESLTPWEIFMLIIGGLLALAGAVNTIGSAMEKIAKARAALKAPNATQNERIDSLEGDMKNVKIFLDNDKRHLAALDEGNRVTQKALLALLAHAIDGNNIDQLKRAEGNLNDYLVNK